MPRIPEGKITTEEEPLGAVTPDEVAHRRCGRQGGIRVSVFPAPHARPFQHAGGAVEPTQVGDNDHRLRRQFVDEPDRVLEAFLEDDGEAARGDLC